MGQNCEAPCLPGTYLLVLYLDGGRWIHVGRLGEFDFPAGYYLYVGSARGPGGLRARLGRHLRGGERQHWHLDHLRRWARPLEAWYATGPQPRECSWQAALQAEAGLSQPVPGFGCSDCRCPTHLFFSPTRPATGPLLARAIPTSLLCRVVVT